MFFFHIYGAVAFFHFATAPLCCFAYSILLLLELKAQRACRHCFVGVGVLSPQAASESIKKSASAKEIILFMMNTPFFLSFYYFSYL